MTHWKRWVWPLMVTGGLVVLVALALHQPAPAQDKDKESEGKPGRYQAVGAGTNFILLDTATGKTWRSHMGFTPFGPGEQVWLPMMKFDTMEAYKKWQAEQDKGMFKDKGPFFPPMPPIPPPPPMFDKKGPPMDPAALDKKGLPGNDKKKID